MNTQFEGHTPGPWHAITGHRKDGSDEVNPNLGRVVCPHCGKSGNERPATLAQVFARNPRYGVASLDSYDPVAEDSATQANARLIAAAPTLLEQRDRAIGAVRKAHEALTDIINAAGNGQPYAAPELERLFVPDCDSLYALLSELDGAA